MEVSFTVILFGVLALLALAYIIKSTLNFIKGGASEAESRAPENNSQQPKHAASGTLGTPGTVSAPAPAAPIKVSEPKPTNTIPAGREPLPRAHRAEESRTKEPTAGTTAPVAAAPEEQAKKPVEKPAPAPASAPASPAAQEPAKPATAPQVKSQGPNADDEKRIAEIQDILNKHVK